MRLNEERMPEQTEKEMKETEKEKNGKKRVVDPIGSNYHPQLPTPTMRYHDEKRKM